jgi:hypothetical protein
MTDWKNEAQKWKALSRKNEILSKINRAKVQILEARLEIATTPNQSPTMRLTATRYIEQRQREIRMYQNLMTEIPGSPQSRVKHRA